MKVSASMIDATKGTQSGDSRSSGGAANSDLDVGYSNEASGPRLRSLKREDLADPLFDCNSGWETKSKQQQAGVQGRQRAGDKAQILSEHESLFLLRCPPDDRIVPACDLLVIDRLNIMAHGAEARAERRGQTLVNLNSQAAGIPKYGRSSAALDAAYAIAARTSSVLRTGNAATICSGESPATRLASTVRKGTRVPLITASPPLTRGSRVILDAKSIMPAL